MKHNLDWDNIQSVFLDMDGTLLDLHFDNHFWQDFLPQQYALKHNIDREEAHRILGPRFRKHEGTLNWYCLDFWSEQLDMDVATMKEEVAHLIDIHDGVINFLEAMTQRPQRIVLMTNAHRKVIELKMRYTQLEVHFDAIISSHDVGYPKENPRFWKELHKYEAYEKEHTLFIDDSDSVLQSAREYGIAHLLTIAKPSSQEAPRTQANFPILAHFEDIIPD